MSIKKELGERIKRFRLDQNMTLKEVELRAEVSATHVSEIERGMTSPTVGALKKIARALGTQPSYFLSNNAYPRMSVSRRGKERVFEYPNWGARITQLSDGVREAQMSFLEVELPESGLNRTLDPMTHTGEALMHVLRGVVEIAVGDDRYLLKEGDSLHFHARLAHTIRNIGDGPARVLWVTSPPMHL